MTPVSSADFLQHLSKMLSLPSNLVRLQINMDVNQLVSVTCTYRPEIRNGFAEPVTQRFGLHRIDEPSPGLSTAQPQKEPVGT